MKKFIKKFSLVVALIMCFGLGFPAPMPLKVSADASTFNVVVPGITIENFKNTATKGEPYILPNYETVSGTAATVTVTDPLGQEVEDIENFIPNMSGTYIISYTYDTHTTDLALNVSGVVTGTEITFEKNNKYIVPSTVNPSDEDNGLEIILPNPSVVDANGDVIPSATIEVSVVFSGESTDFELLPNEFTDDNNETFDVLRLDPEANGTYTISYKYKDGETLLAYANKKIKADTNYNNNFEYTYDYESSLPSSAEIGVSTKLPTISATETETETKVEVYYTVKAQLTTGAQTVYELGDGTDVITQKDGAYYFTPIVNGDYIITYTVKNFFDNEPNVSSTSFQIEDVKDTIAPEPIVVMPYTEEDFNEKGVLTDYIIATEAIANNTNDENIFLFPIYANDAANGIVEDNLTLYRTLKKQPNSATIFNESTDITENVTGKILVFNSTLDITGEPTHTVLTVNINGIDYEITESQVYVVSEYDSEDKLTNGTYTLTYIANDKAGNGEKYPTPYTMVVDSDFEDTDAPTVKFEENLPTAVFLDTKVSFKAPTATDKDKKDTRLSVYVTYKVVENGIESQEIRADANDSIISYDSKTDTYSFEITNSDISKITIIANSRDNSGNLGTAEQEVIILNTGDHELTDIEDVDTTTTQDESELVNGNNILLPTVTYSDDLIEYLNVEILVENNGVKYIAYDATITRNYVANTLTVSDAYFCANATGEYFITYITTDAGNNKSIIVFSVNIGINAGAMNFEFTGLPAQINGGSAEKGESVKLDIPTLDLGAAASEYDLENGTYDLDIKGPSGYQSTGKYYFTPTMVGTYTIQYKANIVNISTQELLKQVTSQVYTIEVVDTTGPSFDKEDILYIENYFADYNAQGVNPGDRITIPLPTLYNDVVRGTSSVAISTSTGGTTTIPLNETNRLVDYRFNRNDTYTITYNLMDEFGNKTSKAFKLEVGDVEPPVLDIDDNLFADEYSINQKIVVDLSKISAIDNIDGQIIIKDEETGIYSLKEGTELTITVKNTSTRIEVESDFEFDADDMRFQYTIPTAGSYTVTIEVADTAGKITTATYNFTVSAGANAGMSAQEILGTVLIIVSVLLLGGVITYFIVSKKNLEKKYK